MDSRCRALARSALTAAIWASCSTRWVFLAVVSRWLTPDRIPGSAARATGATSTAMSLVPTFMFLSITGLGSVRSTRCFAPCSGWGSRQGPRRVLRSIDQQRAILRSGAANFTVVIRHASDEQSPLAVRTIPPRTLAKVSAIRPNTMEDRGVSDTSQGPGWWQASDGKWYPPEQAPGYQPPAAAAAGHARGGGGDAGGPSIGDAFTYGWNKFIAERRSMIIVADRFLILIVRRRSSFMPSSASASVLPPTSTASVATLPAAGFLHAAGLRHLRPSSGRHV